jgi:hypothetical protein
VLSPGGFSPRWSCWPYRTVRSVTTEKTYLLTPQMSETSFSMYQKDPANLCCVQYKNTSCIFCIL